ncbi:DUF397 domain-containing protein [Streptomyces sp. NPDC003006]
MIRLEVEGYADAAWRKSSASAGEHECVEVAHLPGGARAVRDSKNPEGPALAVGPGAWAEFIGGVTG